MLRSLGSPNGNSSLGAEREHVGWCSKRVSIVATIVVTTCCRLSAGLGSLRRCSLSYGLRTEGLRSRPKKTGRSKNTVLFHGGLRCPCAEFSRSCQIIYTTDGQSRRLSVGSRTEERWKKLGVKPLFGLLNLTLNSVVLRSV